MIDAGQSGARAKPECAVGRRSGTIGIARWRRARRALQCIGYGRVARLAEGGELLRIRVKLHGICAPRGNACPQEGSS